MLDFSQREFRAASRARDRAVASYLFDPEVTLIDVGQQIRERQGRQITDQLSVRVHRCRKLRGEAFEVFAAAYPERVVTEQKIGFPIDVIEASYPLQWYPWYSPWLPSQRVQVHDPLRGGISISRQWSLSYGTLGGVVKDRDTNEKMILSNWHVLAGSVYARKGLKILQPAYADGGQDQHTVACLERHAMKNNMDAAVAKLNNTRSWVNDQLDVGPVLGSAAPRLGHSVTKSGRTSKVTHGVVTGIEGVSKISYGGLERLIRHIVHIAQVSTDGQVSAPGDSGSWWVDDASCYAIGLHFAGSNIPEYGVAIAMPQVVDALNVDIVTQIEPGIPEISKHPVEELMLV